MKRGRVVALIALPVVVGIALFFGSLPGKTPSAATATTTAPAAQIAKPPLAAGPRPGGSPSIARIPDRAIIADRNALIDAHDPAHAEALARIERSFGVYLSDSDFVDRLTDEQLAGLVRRLAVARLSQSLHEAALATAGRNPDQSVVISVPAYREAGAALADYVFRDLLRDLDNATVRSRLGLPFYGFGNSPQSFTVSVMRDRQGWNGAPIFLIIHKVDAVFPDIPATTVSGLEPREFGPFAPLARFFPTP